ncbi:MAG: TRAP transporter small permease [Betaproteobacteria bacterium]
MPLDLVRRVSAFGAWVGGLLMLAVAFLVSVEVILRSFFNYALAAGSEISGYVLAIGLAWGFSFALVNRAHVRVDAAIRLLPSKVVAWVDLIAMAALTWYAGLLVIHGWEVFYQSWSRGAKAMTPLLTPMWIPQGLWLAGLAIFLVSCMVFLTYGFWFVATGRLREARALIGTVTAEEEAGSEIEEAKHMLEKARP